MLFRAYTLHRLLILRLPQREHLSVAPPADLLAEVDRLLAFEDEASRGEPESNIPCDWCDAFRSIPLV